MTDLSQWQAIRPSDDMIRLDTTVTIAGMSFPVYFSSSTPLTDSSEALISASILPAMRSGEPIKLHGTWSIDESFRNNLETIQSIYRSWDPTLQPVCYPCSIQPARSMRPTTGRTASFFSGGVDSLYTVLKHSDEITDLIFVHGFDIKLHETALRDKVSGRLQELADKLGKNLIQIETNLRDLLNPHAKWGMLSNGGALATVGLMLSDVFDRIYIPASHTYAQLFPWGSHPVLDPLWSTSSLEFIHDGCEADRIEKVALITQHEAALQNLRVCWQNPDGAYNCGTCEKCIRTQINLAANDALDRCSSFEKPLEPSRVRKIRAYDENTRCFIEENLSALRRRNLHPDLQQALRYVLARPVWPYHTKRRLKAYWREIRGVSRKK